MSDNRGRKRQAPSESSDHSEANENLSADDVLSLPGTATFDGTFSQVSKGKRRRRRFTSERRKQVAKVRQVGACQECRARKVACKHALQGTGTHPDSAPAPKPSPQAYPFDFEAIHPNPTYPTTIWEDDALQWPQSDEPQVQDSSVNDGSDLIATVKALTRRRERLADDLHDFDNVIEDNSERSTIKGVSNTSGWSQDSPWMMSTIALTNNHQLSQPSTADPYSNTNISIDMGPSSTPASSHTDLRSTYTQDISYCPCNLYGCVRTHKFTQEMHMKRHQEIDADLQPQTGAYPCPARCGVKPFRKSEYLHNHVKCNHLEILSTLTQLPPSNVSEHDAQLDRRAQLDNFLAEAYFPGMEHNLITIADQGASGGIDSLTIDDFRQQKSARRAENPRIHHVARMRRPNSLMQRQLSERTTDDHAIEIQGQFGITRSNCAPGITPANPNASFQLPALQGQDIMEGINNFDVQHEVSPSQVQHINSPAPSLSGHFARTMQISDQSPVFQSSSDFGEDLAHSAIQQDHQAVTVTMSTIPLRTSTALHRSLDPQNQPMNLVNTQTPDPYDTIGLTQTDASFQRNYGYSKMRMPMYSGQGASTFITQTKGFSNGYAPPEFRTEAQDSRYLMDDATWLSFHIPPDTAKGPIITLNNGSMPQADQDGDLTFDLNTFNSDPILLQQNDIPNLDYSNMSSSGASESLLSPVDASNLFADRCKGELDSASLMNGFNNMGIITNDESM